MVAKRLLRSRRFLVAERGVDATKLWTPREASAAQNALRLHAGRLVDPAIEAQIFQLEAEYRKLVEVERRVTSEMDVHRTQRDILFARQTAAQAQERMSELIGALDEAHAHAAALAESVIDVGV